MDCATDHLKMQHLDSDYLQPFSTVLNYFKLTGIDIFDEGLTFLKTKRLYLLMLPLHVVITIGCWCFVVQAVRSGVDLLDVIIDLSYASGAVEGLFLYLHFLYSKKKIKTFVLNLGKEWRDDENLSPDLVALKRKKIKSLDRFYYVYLVIITIFRYAYMLSPIAVIIVKKFIFKAEVAYILPFRLLAPFKYEDNFMLYLLVFGVLYVVTTSLTYLINGSILLLTVCITQLRIRFELLQNEFRDIFNSEDVLNIDEKIIRAIRKHSRLLKLYALPWARFVSEQNVLFSLVTVLLKLALKYKLLGGRFIHELSSAFGAIFAIHLFFLSAMICFYCVAAMINGRLEDQKNVIISIISVATIYHCCYNGQLLSDASANVGLATYESEWSSLSCEHKKIMLIIMLRSQRVTYVQSTSLTFISLTTFVKIMNMAWSFISLINGMYE